MWASVSNYLKWNLLVFCFATFLPCWGLASGSLTLKSCRKIFSDSFRFDKIQNHSLSVNRRIDPQGPNLNRFVEQFSNGDWTLFFDTLDAQKSPLVHSVPEGAGTKLIKTSINSVFQNYLGQLRKDVFENDARKRSLIEQWEFRSGKTIRDWGGLETLSEARLEQLLSRLPRFRNIEESLQKSIEQFISRVDFQFIHNTHVRFEPNDNTTLLSAHHLKRLKIGEASLNSEKFNTEYLGVSDNLFFFLEPFHISRQAPRKSPGQDYGSNSIVLKKKSLKTLWASPYLMYVKDIKADFIDSLNMSDQTNVILRTLETGVPYRGGPQSFSQNSKEQARLVELREKIAQNDLLWADMSVLLVQALEVSLQKSAMIDPASLPSLLVSLTESESLRQYFSKEVYPILGWIQPTLEVKVPSALFPNEFYLELGSKQYSPETKIFGFPPVSPLKPY